MERIACKIVTVIFLLVAPAFVLAEPSSPIKIIHSALTVDKLPDPGDEIKLIVNLEGTKAFNQQFRAVIVRDGKLFEIVPNEATIDNNDKPKFTFIVNAPTRTLSYQFVLIPQTGESISSDRFTVSRGCVPRAELTTAEAEDLASDNYVTLSKLSNGLEKDIHTYDVLTKIIDSLVSLLQKPEEAKR